MLTLTLIRHPRAFISSYFFGEMISTRPDELPLAEAIVVVVKTPPLVIVVVCVPALGSKTSTVPLALLLALASVVVVKDPE